MNKNDTIVAAATPYGYGGIAVVRLSGPLALKVAKKITGYKKAFINRRATNVGLINKNGKQFDSALLTFFKSPLSYTGEDVVELSCHGSPMIVDEIITRCCGLGARYAEPGEFTKRAFLNGKIDLIQAEAVADLIHSKTVGSSSLNQKNLSGFLSEEINQIKNMIIEALSYIEYNLDISEEETDQAGRKYTLRKVKTAQRKLLGLKRSYREGRLINNGASVVLTGKPNTGKSTLFNALLNEDRAITHAEPGTTRDVLESSLIINGLFIQLYDTAGIRDSNNPIEIEGIKRANTAMSGADIVLTIFDASISSPEKARDKRTLNVGNKIDLLNGKIPKIENGFVYVSAQNKWGLEDLKKAIYEKLSTSDSVSDLVYLTTKRQFNAVAGCAVHVSRALRLLRAPFSAHELVSVEIRSALDKLDLLLGKTTSEDILNSIFRGFCVGK